MNIYIYIYIFIYIYIHICVFLWVVVSIGCIPMSNDWVHPTPTCACQRCVPWGIDRAGSWLHENHLHPLERGTCRLKDDWGGKFNCKPYQKFDGCRPAKPNAGLVAWVELICTWDVCEGHFAKNMLNVLVSHLLRGLHVASLQTSHFSRWFLDGARWQCAKLTLAG